MSGASRRAALADRVSQLSGKERRALEIELGSAIRGSERQQLVAFVMANSVVPTLSDVRAFLQDRLPEYMIPVRFVVLQELPRTLAGKLDRQAVAHSSGIALDDGGVEGVTTAVAPRNTIEARLAEIWKDVLGIEEVSVHDDFFEVGGDSLLSIRVISRAARAGIVVAPEVFFSGPTIANIAASAGNSSAHADQGPVVGEAPLTPIQEWFFDRIRVVPSHWNQSMLLVAPASVDADVLADAGLALVIHHDALRSCFVRQGTGWRQQVADVPSQFPVRVVNLTDVPDAERDQHIDRAATAEHESMNLEDGNLFRVVLFVAEPAYRRLLLVAHHLVVDGVSWGILLEDLSNLLVRPSEMHRAMLPRKTTSARDWAEQLLVRAAGSDLLEAAEHWRRQVAHADWAFVPVDVEGRVGANLVATAATHSQVILQGDTRAFLDSAREQNGHTIQELLLATLLVAWNQWTGRLGLQLDIEGHGRDVLADNANVSRTVGWFTTVFPLTLASSNASVVSVMKAVGEALANLPLRGAAHGLIRFLHSDVALRREFAEHRHSELLFNYLGNLDSLLPSDSPLQLASEATGQSRSTKGLRAYVIEINVSVTQGRLTFAIEYSKALHHAASIAQFAAHLSAAVAAITRHVSGADTAFALSGLDQKGIDQVAHLLAALDEE